MSDCTSQWEMLAMLGVFGSCISGVQAFVLERGQWGRGGGGGGGGGPRQGMRPPHRPGDQPRLLPSSASLSLCSFSTSLCQGRNDIMGVAFAPEPLVYVL